MIQLPKTLKEYTNGKLWYEGIDVSIAERMLAGYDKVESFEERDERKMYIAHYFCEIGNYLYAAEIVNSLLMEGKYVEESIDLMRKISVADDSVDDFERIARFAKERPDKAMEQSWVFDALSIKLPESLTKSYQVGKDGYVVSSNGRDYYYKNGKLLYSVANRDYGAYINAMSVKYYINEGQYKRALKLLKDINLEGTTAEIRNTVYKSLVEVYCELKDYDSAFEYCKKLIESNEYIPYISDVFFAMYLDGKRQADELKEFLTDYKGYKILDLCDMHSLSGEIEGGEEFWNRILANNPIPEDDISEETTLLRGMLHFNAGEILLAKKEFAKLANSCGSFGRGHLMLKYLEYYEKNLQKSVKADDMPDKLYTAQLDWIQDYVGKKMSKQLKKISSAEEFKANCEENIVGLKALLYSAQSKLGGVFDIVDRLYNIGSAAAQDIINMVVSNEDYNVLVRAICFAQFLVNKKPEKIVINGCEYDNCLADLEAVGKRRNLVYGIAMYCAFAMLTGFDRQEIKKQTKVFRKIYDAVTIDYSKANPCTVFGLLFSYAADSDKLDFVGTVMKKKDAQELIYDIYSGWHNDFDIDSSKELDDDVHNFLIKCGSYMI